MICFPIRYHSVSHETAIFMSPNVAILRPPLLEWIWHGCTPCWFDAGTRTHPVHGRTPCWFGAGTRTLFPIPVHPSLILLSFLLLLVLLFSISALFPQASMQSKSYSLANLSEIPMFTVHVTVMFTLYLLLFPAIFDAFPFDCLGPLVFPWPVTFVLRHQASCTTRIAAFVALHDLLTLASPTSPVFCTSNQSPPHLRSFGDITLHRCPVRDQFFFLWSIL